MYKVGDVVFIVTKFTNTDNSLVIDIRKRIIYQIDESELLGKPLTRYWLKDVDGNPKSFIVNESDFFKTKEEALSHYVNIVHSK